MATDAKTWAGRIAAWQSSGLSARAFAQGKGYSAASLYFWRRRLAEAGGEFKLARVVRVRADQARTAPVAATPCWAAITVEIGGARVIVPPNFDGTSLRAILDLLSERSAEARS